MERRSVSFDYETVSTLAKMYGIDVATDEGMDRFFLLALSTMYLLGAETQNGKIIVSVNQEDIEKIDTRVIKFPLYNVRPTLRMVVNNGN